MKTLPFAFIFFLFFLLIKICPALSQQITFNKVTPQIGNFSGFISGIAQDKNGYMWIATGGGLYRYDGYRFKFYSYYRSDTSFIPSQRLETVYADRKGFIWIATWIDGMDRLDPLTGKFTHFQHNPDDRASLSNDTVRSFYEDRDGILWIGTNSGLDRYDPQTGKFKNYDHDPNDLYSLSCNRVRKIYEDRQGTLWVGTGSVWNGEGGGTDEGGLNRFDKKTGKFISYRNIPHNPHSLINNKVQSIYEDSKGRFWIGTAGDGLHTMDRATGMFERHLYDAAHPEKLSRPPIKNVSGPDHITFINEDSLGGIWIGTLGNGINYYASKTGKMIHYGTESGAAGFTDNSGWSFCISRDGVVWIGTWQGGLFRVDPFPKNIPHFTLGNSVSAFNEDPVNGFWIGTTEGLIFQNKTDKTSKRFVHNDRDQASISNNYVFSMFRDSQGTLWIGTANGLNRFNAPSNGFTRYEHNPEDRNSIAEGSIYAIVDACGDSLWIGASTGLNLMDKETGTFTHFNPKDINGLSGVSALANDKSGNLWIGRYPGGGVNHFDCKAKTFKHFLKGLSVFSLLVGSDGTLWVGTEGDGIYRSKSSGSEFTKFTDPGSGIENASVSSIQQDDQNNLWLRTNHGIYKIDTRTYQSTVFGKNYEVKFDNLNLLPGYKGMHGEIYFGDLHGYYVISPEELFSNPIPPQVVLTDFRVGGKSLIFEGNLLDTSLETIKKISLRHDQNVLSFEFAGIHYSDPAGNRHLYMLENYDQAWREAGAEKAAHYFNVPPGHYVFKIKAASSEGLWAERSVDIIIAPPWWRTWWAFCIYGLLFISGVYFIHRIQKQRVIRKERERTRVYELAQAKEIEKAYKALSIKSAELEEQKEELQTTLENLKTTQGQLIQSEKMASLGELTAGIAHEIQNPLNFVNNFSEVNKELLTEMKDEIEKGNLNEVKTLANDVIENQEKINQHGKRADAIVKGMLQHSRTSSGQKEPTDINVLADEYLRLAYHGLRAKDKSFNAKFETDFDQSIEKINVVPQDIGRVILNLINNAFYSISEKQKQDIAGYEPTLIVATKKINDKIEIRIKDNGNGIPQKVMDKIFQPFFTTKPTGQGTGLGLSLAYDIITQGHNGELKVENKEQQGAVFIIILPVV